jgi:hypothetical protein
MKASALRYTKRERRMSAADHRIGLACRRRCERIDLERRVTGDDGIGSVCWSGREKAEDLKRNGCWVVLGAGRQRFSSDRRARLGNGVFPRGEFVKSPFIDSSPTRGRPSVRHMAMRDVKSSVMFGSRVATSCIPC